ncbi:MAG: hypothetical protein ISQ09_01810 [Rubripirellula sp.]|nr:hypothetical protein [Rubripirellula sp.]
MDPLPFWILVTVDIQVRTQSLVGHEKIVCDGGVANQGRNQHWADRARLCEVRLVAEEYSFAANFVILIAAL